ncbi:MAG: hypothetical protein P1V97_30290, partial [Planctomycetota bacterium]|nr:hypothetical protein [Planctomycetota bacterium]
MTKPFMNYEAGMSLPIEDTTAESEEPPKDLEALRVTPTFYQEVIASDLTTSLFILAVILCVTAIVFAAHFAVMDNFSLRAVIPLIV